MTICPPEITEQVNGLERLVQACKGRIDHLSEKRNPQDLRDQVLIITLARVLKYCDAYLLLARQGFGEPAACLLRSVLEGNLWIRWSLMSLDNAQRYFDAGKGEGIRMLDLLLSKNLMRIEHAPDPQLIRTMLKDSLKKERLPKWDVMANQAGLGDLYALVYPFLSAMAHGSLLFLGERMEKKTVSPDANWDNIGPFVPWVHNLVSDCLAVSERWVLHREVLAPPDYRALMTKR